MMIVISLTNRWRHLRKRGEIQVNHREVIFWEQFCDIMIRYEVDITYVVVFAWFQSDFNRFSSYSFFADTPAATLLHPKTSPPKKHQISSQKWPGKGLEHTDYFRKFLRWRERFFVFFSTKKNWGHRFILNSPYPSSKPAAAKCSTMKTTSQLFPYSTPTSKTSSPSLSKTTTTQSHCGRREAPSLL